MILAIIAIGLVLMILERLAPDEELPSSPGWWRRVIVLNVFQAAVVLLGSFTWDRAFDRRSWMNWSFGEPWQEAILAYVVITFIFYWWHLWRHRSMVLWNAFHQVHHSPVRIETITSFYKHPLEIAVNSVLIGFVIHGLLGFGPATAKWLTLYTATAEFLYHMNIKTPHWWGYFFQRPEMHRLHHERGRHDRNFSDLPLWDMLFGTYENPPTVKVRCGFEPPREQMLWSMLSWNNVNRSRKVSSHAK